MKPMTHTAIREGRAYNHGRDYKTKVRFTKRHIVDEYGIKYDLKSGTPTSEKYATYGINIESIEEIK